MLLAVPNFSEGRRLGTLREIVDAFSSGDPELLDFHFDTRHNRTAVTIAGAAGSPRSGSARGRPRRGRARSTCGSTRAPTPASARSTCARSSTCARTTAISRSASALDAAERIAAELEVPVFLYGELATASDRRERAFFRRGGLPELTRRMQSGELKPDRGPDEPHPTAGATLVTARPPLAAFNLLLDTQELEVGKQIAAELREAGGGLPGVRAIALELEDGIQISTNVHDPVAVPLRRVVAEVERLGEPSGASPTSAELVGLVPQAALDGFPAELEWIDPDIDARVIERRLAQLD